MITKTQESLLNAIKSPEFDPLRLEAHHLGLLEHSRYDELSPSAMPLPPEKNRRVGAVGPPA